MFPREEEFRDGISFELSSALVRCVRRSKQLKFSSSSCGVGCRLCAVVDLSE